MKPNPRKIKPLLRPPPLPPNTGYDYRPSNTACGLGAATYPPFVNGAPPAGYPHLPYQRHRPPQVHIPQGAPISWVPNHT